MKLPALKVKSIPIIIKRNEGKATYRVACFTR